MDIGLGLPIAPDADLLTWARRADAGPFTTLGLADRLVYDNPDTLITLAGLATVTTRVRLQSEVLIVPNHNTAVLAKQAATLDRLSGGRLVLGVGVGVREDDALAAGIDMRRRGGRLDAQLAQLHRAWSGEPYGEGVGPVGPEPLTAGGPPLLFGGFAPAAFERVGRWGAGFLGAGADPAGMDGLFREVEKAWARHSRPGRPRLVAQANAVLGDASVVAEAHANLRRYYSSFYAGTEDLVTAMLTTPQAIRDAVAGYAAVGADELMLYCWAAGPDQVGRFADALAG